MTTTTWAGAFGRLLLSFAARKSTGARPSRLANAEAAGGSSRAARAGGAAGAAGAGGILDEKDPNPPPVTLTLVERRLLHVNPLNEYGGKITCGPFEWRLSNRLIAKLDVAANTESAWLYPVALGQVTVTVAGAKREVALAVAIVEAIPATLNLVADEPEVFRTLGSVDNAAGGVL